MSSGSSAPFVSRPLRSVPLWRRLSQKPLAENAAIELENLLAAGDGGVAAISRILKSYRLSGAAVRDLLSQAYARALLHVLADETITDEEHEFLVELRRRLGLSDTEVADVHAATIHPRYERALADVLADAHISEAERETLERIQASLRLPENVRRRIYSAVAGAKLEQSLASVTSDRRLSPEEEADVKAMAKNLGLEIRLSAGSQVMIDRFRLLWRIENGDIPVQPAQIDLYKDETCHFRSPAAWRELRRATGRGLPIGTAPNPPIVRGVRFRAGGPSPSIERHESLVQVDTGTIYLTNKRVLFYGTSNNRSIGLTRIRTFQVFADAIVIEPEKGRAGYLFIEGDIEMAATVLGAVLQA